MRDRIPLCLPSRHHPTHLVRPGPRQVTSSVDLEAHCTGRPGLCLLALLDSGAPGYEAERKVGPERG